MRQMLEWQIATIKTIKAENADVKTFTLVLPTWSAHQAGQHYDLRLIAPDGYQAQRSYSIASSPERTGEIDLTVERLDDGEVSSYLHDTIVVGDQVEVRGPIGGYFVWDAAMPGRGGALLLIAGGSGVVPLMAMIRHRKVAGSSIPTRLLYSSRTPNDVIYRDELDALSLRQDGLTIVYTFTRAQPSRWAGYARRVDEPMLREVAAPLGNAPATFICGPTALVESAATILVKIGIAPEQIRTERFGPTGG